MCVRMFKFIKLRTAQGQAKCQRLIHELYNSCSSTQVRWCDVVVVYSLFFQRIGYIRIRRY